MDYGTQNICTDLLSSLSTIYAIVVSINLSFHDQLID